MGDKLFAVPMKALQQNKDRECFILNATKEELKNTSGFDQANWSDMADRRWGEGVHDFYKAQPYWKRDINFF